MSNDIKTGKGDMSGYRVQVGRQFQMIREEAGWSREQVALMADVKEATIEKIETGAFNVQLDILARVADVLGCELNIKSKEL